ncbi:hypothetical protein BH11PLA2_BH11PLA2_34590 [soil metagenome]
MVAPVFLFVAAELSEVAISYAVKQAAAQVLTQFGALVAERAKASITDSKKPSRPGEPPHSHSGTLRNLIVSYYNPDACSVYVGPEKLSGKIGDAPVVLELGGETQIRVRRPGSRKPGRIKTVTVAARPYIRPAFDAEIPSLPALWKDSVRS